MNVSDLRQGRRQFLRFLATSPALASALLPHSIVEALEGTPGLIQSTKKYAGLGDEIASPDHAVDVFDFETLAKAKLPPAHWGYLATGVDEDATIQANRDGFKQWRLRPRRLVDVREIDTSITLMGRTWPTPIVIAPTGSNGAFHPDGELAVARAARAKNHLQMLSTVASNGVEKVNEARGEPVWYQLYPFHPWNVTSAVVDRAEAAGCPVVVLTVDLQGGSNRVTLKKFSRLDSRACDACHTEARNTPMFDGHELADNNFYQSLDWEFVARLQSHTSMKVFIKGIVEAEDARLAIEHGVDGIVISNHGGRAEESARSTIECLPAIADVVRGRIPIIIDSGFRRGGDIFKALALGADAVAIGRPYLWGLASFGQAGVEAVLEMLRRELQIVMRQAGTLSIGEITSNFVASRNP